MNDDQDIADEADRVAADLAYSREKAADPFRERDADATMREEIRLRNMLRSPS